MRSAGSQGILRAAAVGFARSAPLPPLRSTEPPPSTGTGDDPRTGRFPREDPIGIAVMKSARPRWQRIGLVLFLGLAPIWAALLLLATADYGHSEEELIRGPRGRTRYRMDKLEAEIRLQVSRGREIRTLESLLAPLSRSERKRFSRDGWSQPIHLEVSEREFILRSAGGDGLLGTPDDLVRTINPSVPPSGWLPPAPSTPVPVR